MVLFYKKWESTMKFNKQKIKWTKQLKNEKSSNLPVTGIIYNKNRGKPQKEISNQK